MGLTIGDVVAVLALLLSSYATWRTHKQQEQEATLAELQRQINFLVLRKEEREARESELVDLGANFVMLGTQKHRLRVFNKGRVTAYDVQVTFPEGNDLILEEDIRDKMPLESMQPGQSVDLLAAVSMGSPRKMTVRLSWTDANRQKVDKDVHLTL